MCFPRLVKELELAGFSDLTADVSAVLLRPLISPFPALTNQLVTSGWVHLIGAAGGFEFLVSRVAPWIAAVAARGPLMPTVCRK